MTDKKLKRKRNQPIKKVTNYIKQHHNAKASLKTRLHGSLASSSIPIDIMAPIMAGIHAQRGLGLQKPKGVNQTNGTHTDAWGMDRLGQSMQVDHMEPFKNINVFQSIDMDNIDLTELRPRPNTDFPTIGFGRDGGHSDFSGTVQNDNDYYAKLTLEMMKKFYDDKNMEKYDIPIIEMQGISRALRLFTTIETTSNAAEYAENTVMLTRAFGTKFGADLLKQNPEVAIMLENRLMNMPAASLSALYIRTAHDGKTPLSLTESEEIWRSEDNLGINSFIPQSKRDEAKSNAALMLRSGVLPHTGGIDFLTCLSYARNIENNHYASNPYITLGVEKCFENTNVPMKELVGKVGGWGSDHNLVKKYLSGDRLKEYDDQTKSLTNPLVATSVAVRNGLDALSNLPGAASNAVKKTAIAAAQMSVDTVGLAAGKVADGISWMTGGYVDYRTFKDQVMEDITGKPQNAFAKLRPEDQIKEMQAIDAYYDKVEKENKAALKKQKALEDAQRVLEEESEKKTNRKKRKGTATHVPLKRLK